MLKSSLLQKSLLGLLIAISSACYSQTVTIPDSIAAKVIDELILYDGAKVKLNLQDSIIRVYKHKDSTNLEKIKELKLNARDYQLVIADLTKISEIDKATINQLEKELKAVRRREIIILILSVAAIILI